MRRDKEEWEKKKRKNREEKREYKTLYKITF